MYKSQRPTKYTNLAKYERERDKLEEKRNKLMRSGKYMESIRLNADIENLNKLIAKEKEYEPKPLKELVSPDKSKEAVTLIVECHLAADFLTATAFALKDWFTSNGLVAVSVIPELNDIIKRSEAFASSVCRVNDNLSHLMTDNETLIEALHKKTLSYIGQRLNK